MAKSPTDWFIEQRTIIAWLGKHTTLMWFWWFFAITFPYWISLMVHLIVFPMPWWAIFVIPYGILTMPILNIGFTLIIIVLPPTWIAWIFLLWLAFLVKKHNKKELEEQSHSKTLPSEQKLTD